jgi:hypothetical protein
LVSRTIGVFMCPPYARTEAQGSGRMDHLAFIP